MVNEGEIENERIVKGDKEDERWKNIMEWKWGFEGRRIKIRKEVKK